MEAKGLATTPFSSPEIEFRPTEMMAQQGSRPSWLRALLGKIRTTTAQASTDTIAFLTNLHGLASRFIVHTPTGALAPVASGSAGCGLMPRSVAARRSGRQASPPPGAIQRRAFSPTGL